MKVFVPMAKEDDVIEVGKTATDFAARGDAWAFFARVLPSQFPAVAQILNEFTGDNYLEFNRKKLRSALKGVSSCYDLTETVSFIPDEEGVRVRSANPLADFEDLVPAKKEGETFTIHLGGGYVQQMLSAFKGESVRLEANGAKTPTLWFNPEKTTTSDGHLRMVIMPLEI